jgi:metal-responsive CopG/Arc/MetJ family transcriptional regulator
MKSVSAKKNEASDPIIPVSMTLPKSLVTSSDERAKSLDMTRSQYFRKLAREDLARAEKEQVQQPTAA